MKINKIAVIGSGVMGSAIAAHIANAGFEVLLLDIASNDKDPNILAKTAIDKLYKTRALTCRENAKMITPGNLSDHIIMLKEMDLIIEVIVEKLSIKENLYKEIDKYRKKPSIVVSNTSTLPLAKLVENMDDSFRKDFLITHFFNPPRYMRLLELVYSSYTTKDNIKTMQEFLDKDLGKGVVECKDTPGFIANRIGCFWLEVACNEAIKHNLLVEDVDEILGKPFGIPKTAIFGLWDLIGIDLMPLIASSLITSLPEDDDFTLNYKEHDLTKKMTSNGLIGRKGKGGFYKISKDGGKKIKEVINLQTGEYSLAKPSTSNYSNLSIQEILQSDDSVCRYAKIVMLKTLCYVAKLIPEISDEIVNIDNAMKLGYSWKFGPFQLIDIITPNKLRSMLKENNLAIPDILINIENRKFYKDDKYYSPSNLYRTIKKPEGIFTLADYKNKKPLLENDYGALWNIGDNVACFEIKTKMNIAKKEVFQILDQAIDLVSKNSLKGMIIGNDSANFCVGGDLEHMLNCAKNNNLKDLDSYLKCGQDVMLKIKYSNFPIVMAHKGFALGGGTEFLMHSSYIVSHIEACAGLVEAKVGLIPAWGGTKESILKSSDYDKESLENMFDNIITGNITESATTMKSHFKFNNQKIIMNIDRVLSEAKNKVVELSNNFLPRIKKDIKLSPKKNIQIIRNFLDNKKSLSSHDIIIANKVLDIFIANSEVEKTINEQDLLDFERAAFINLSKTEETQLRIENILKSKNH